MHFKSFTMYFQNIVLSLVILALSGVFSSPVDQDLQARNLPPEACQKVIVIVKVLQLNKATPFCSSFLQIATQTSTVVAYVNASLSMWNFTESKHITVPRQQRVHLTVSLPAQLLPLLSLHLQSSLE